MINDWTIDCDRVLFPVMSKIDSENERLRLTARYASMTDGELDRIAGELDALNDVAREVLRAEMTNRSLQPPKQLTTIALEAKQQSELPRPTVLRRYRDLTEAMVAKSVLDSAGIDSFLADGNVVRMDWLWSNAVGGIKLLVRTEDVEAATKLLDEATPESFEVAGVGEYQQPKCPQCGSMDITFGEADKHLKAAGFIVGLPLKATIAGWNCHSCGSRWDDEEPPPSPITESNPDAQ